LLLAEYQCPLDQTRYDIWSHHNYFIYVISGQKKWFTRSQEILVREGDCLFVRKGAHSVYQYFDKDFCAVVLFLPDGFIRSVLLENRITLDSTTSQKDLDALFPIDTDVMLSSYFYSFLNYLEGRNKIENKLLELKFKELVMVTASRKYNPALLAYFERLCKTGKPSLSDVMDKNFYYPLTLQEVAKLSGRSLSAFKSDFMDLYQISPGKWLKKKRLEYSRYLLRHSEKSVTEVVFDSGFQNTSHFSREFKNKYGSSPLSYKKSYADVP
jgi:AraC family transcriptional regulator, exoenzyme S synthesis regulatory protein ExsA